MPCDPLHQAAGTRVARAIIGKIWRGGEGFGRNSIRSHSTLFVGVVDELSRECSGDP
jgi:hypothetical protein